MDTRTLTRPVLCLVTAGRAPVDTIRAAAQSGVTLIQIRERGLDDRALLALVRSAIDATAGTAARIVVNDRLDVALAAAAAGVHLRSDSMVASDARQLTPAGFLIGRSVHSVEEALQAERDGGCDYLIFGTVFQSASKPLGHAVAGPDALAGACAAVSLPVLAIGGITIDNIPAVAAAGAAGVAGIGLYEAKERLADTVRTVRSRFDTCYPHPR